MFVDRKEELRFLDSLINRKRLGPAQLVLLYGRRRVGKSELLIQWAMQSGLDYVYWEAVKETATLQRTRLFAKLLDVPPTSAPVYRTWPDLWDAAVPLLRNQRRILILDELPYAAEADTAMLSALQYAWDQYFQKTNHLIVLCGSQVRVMETLLSRQSPLFGRMTAQWHLGPLPFSCLIDFFPKWTAEERVAAYAIVGGIPAYLNWLDPGLDLTHNILDVILNSGSMFLAEPGFLLYDEVREPASYLAILKAIGSGAHTVTGISERAFLPTTSLNFYLNNLQELHLVERRLPVLQTKEQRARSKFGRYHLSDPYFRFYFQFVEPYLASSPISRQVVLENIRSNLRAFVGRTAFEELSRQWVTFQGRSGKLPFEPETVGSHWNNKVQVDVVAVNRQNRQILLGECKWGEARVDRQVARELIDVKTPLVLRDLPDQGEGWKVHYALFGRKGFTPAAARQIEERGGLLVNLDQIDSLLSYEVH